MADSPLHRLRTALGRIRFGWGRRLGALSLALLLVGWQAGWSPAAAQRMVSGVLGSPAARATISGNQLPAPAPSFGGVIKDNALESTSWWPPTVVPPKDAPNVLLIMTDDAGFAINSVFGGVIPTPAMERIASQGLRYNRIMSTALCSPTRAALITDATIIPWASG